MAIILMILGSILLLLVLLLSLPIAYRVHCSRNEETAMVAKISWFGLASASYELGQGVQLRLCGRRVNISQPRKQRSSKKSKAKKDKKRSNTKVDIRAVVQIIRKVFAHVSPSRLEGDIRLGFEDPYYTGVINALLCTMPIGKKRVRITPVFEDEVLEGWFLVEGRAVPIMVLWIALRGYAPFLYRNIVSKLRPNERKVESNVRS